MSRLSWTRLRSQLSQRPQVPVLIAIVVVGILARAVLFLRPLNCVVSLFIADDYFYYLNTAFYIASGRGSTFDGGLTFHNGYHPLFLVFLVLLFKLGLSKVTMVYVGLAIQTIGNAVAAVFAFRIANKLGSPWAALCVPAVLSLNLYLIRMTLWGFETMLAIAMVLGFVDALLNRRGNVALGIWLGLAILARVDAVLLFFPLVLFFTHERRWRGLVSTSVITLFLVSPWVAWSWLRFGTALPQSGQIKMLSHDVENLWFGWQIFCSKLMIFAAGPDLERIAPLGLKLIFGVLIFLLSLRPGRKAIYLLGYVALLVCAYSLRTNPYEVIPFVRYIAPGAVVLLTLGSAGISRFRVPVLGLVLLSLVPTTQGYVKAMSKQPAIDSYPGVCQSIVPDVLKKVVGSDDRVGSFDSGVLGYFSPVPVINLDGLVNSEVVAFVTNPDPAAGTWTIRYERYLHEKGITILVGATAFSWINIFPDAPNWKRLSPPIPTTDANEVLILRVPDFPKSHKPGSSPTAP